ncbi:hypothetical protein BU23DRAFT_566247 [Bimuria novae-zelandiae CBS 107.79]|uniref:Uncharacterized protein n=1 Tax=Bimuria novae-zelandiae CBS 107.79 TaxID=1447943 RepID=A0A6A5VFW2_9PLEO|nr:hypothetical protein BU23DRAFT_566247 [Bimuria novae-zelandiae CBS 107.79]
MHWSFDRIEKVDDVLEIGSVKVQGSLVIALNTMEHQWTSLVLDIWRRKIDDSVKGYGLLRAIVDVVVPVAHSDVLLSLGCDNTLGNDINDNIFHARFIKVWEVLQLLVLQFVEPVPQLGKHATIVWSTQIWMLWSKSEQNETRDLEKVDGAPVVRAGAFIMREVLSSTS